MSAGSDDFYIGYAKSVPKSLHGPLIVAAIFTVFGFAWLALLLALTQDEVGDGGFLWNAGNQNIRGIFDAKPYPVIYSEPTAAFPNGHTYLLAGEGKIGVRSNMGSRSLAFVEASGIVIKRGTLDMLQVSGDVGPSPVSVDHPLASTKPKIVDLGRWRVRGEICDGKCYAGAMKPGTGLAHKACANLCLIGRLPPVLVTEQAVAGYNFFLLGTLNGEPLTDSMLDYVAIPIEVEGRIQRRGDMPVLLFDQTTLKAR